MRERRDSGRIWLLAEVVVAKNIRISWDLICAIEKSSTSNDQRTSSIKCKNFVALRTGKYVHAEGVGHELSFDEYSTKGLEDIVAESTPMIVQIDETPLKSGIHGRSIMKK